MTSNEVVVNGKRFVKSFDKASIEHRVDALASTLDEVLEGREPLFLVVLRGAFVFASDLIRKLKFDPEVEFVRVSSYEGLQSTGIVHIGEIPDSTVIEGRHVVIVEDIVESGRTLKELRELLHLKGAAGTEIVSMFFKPAKLECELDIEHVGFEIPDDFIIGYGLDYDGKGRGLKSVYALSSEQ